MSQNSVNFQKKPEGVGLTELANSCRQLISKIENEQGFMTADPAVRELNYNLYWMTKYAIAGRFKKENVINAISNLSKLHCEVCSILMDIFNILDAELSILDAVSEERINLSQIIKNCEKLFTDKLLKERLEPETLQEIKILNNKNFQTKFIKVKTKLYYKQKKFNLFREECEGYAKLITELNQNNVTVSYILEVVMSLIGCFNLDPNRVLDVILDSFESQTNREDFYISLIKQYMDESKVLCEVLGFKYLHHHNSSEEITPSSLYVITALLLQHEIISFEDIYCWLMPNDEVIIEEWKKEFVDNDIPFKKGFSTVVLLEKNTEAAEMIQKPFEEHDVEKYAGNQKFGLLYALINVGDWDNCQKIMKRLPSPFLMAYPPITYSACKLVHWMIDPIYKKNNNISSFFPGSVPEPFKNQRAPEPIKNLPDLRNVVFPILHALGPYLACDVKLLYKIIRICKAAVMKATVPSERNNLTNDGSLYYDVVTILDIALLPSLSSLEHNCCVGEEIWDIMKLYPYHIRYCLYGRWKNDTIKKYPHLAWHNAYVQKKSREVMKRISKEASKIFGRLLGKLTHFCAGALFDYLLTQILLYDNLIAPMVDSFKYLGTMSYDILGYCIIELLATPGRTPTKHNNLTLSNWLVNLAAFVGLVYKRYPIDLTGILQYICNQIKVHQSFELIILKELVQKMAGTDISDEMTNEQLLASCGGDCLKAEAGYFNHVRNTKKSALRLKDALLQHDLAFSLCLLIAQQRDCIIYKNPGSLHLKLVGKLYDQCQETLINYGTFLGSQLSIEEYISRIPQVHSLMKDYHLQTDVVFFLSRPMINHVINLKYDVARKSEPNFKKLPQAVKLQLYYNAAAVTTNPIAESLRPFYPAKVWEDMSFQFLFLFWSLSLYDIYVPIESYAKEIAKLEQVTTSIADNKEFTQSKAKKESDRCTSLIEKLQDEQKKQIDHSEKILYRLNQDKENWFISKSQKITKNEAITQFLQHCLFPRCIFTMADALFCSKFINTLHVLKTPNFSTLLCYDRLFCDIVYSITLCTENEAHRYGRFLCEVLETVSRWHSDKAIFDKECANYPGFVTKFRVSSQFSEASEHVGYENYRHVCHKWHYKITKSLLVCLESKDFIQIRNALIILTKIISYFPVLLKLSQIIEKKVVKIRDEEKIHRPDLYTMAISYCGILKNRNTQYIREQDFHMVSPPVIIKETDEEQKSVVKNGNPPTSAVISVINLVNDDNNPIRESKTRANGKELSIDVDEMNDARNKDKPKKLTDYSDGIVSDKSGKTRHREESAGKERSSKKADKKDDDRKSKESKSKEDRRSTEKIYRDDRYRDEKERIKSAVFVSSGGHIIEDGAEHDSDVEVRAVSHYRTATDNNERDSKRRKLDTEHSNRKPSKHRSVSESPDSNSSIILEKEKYKKSTDDGLSGSHKRKVSVRKRVKTSTSEEDRKKRKTEEDLSLKMMHQNGDNHNRNVVHAEKHHRPSGDKVYHDREKIHERSKR